MRLQVEELRQFIRDAKLASYASGQEPARDHFVRRYSYAQNALNYQDTYSGNIVDVGIEIITYHDYPLWAMSYRGGITDDRYARDSAAVIEFLRSALQMPPTDLPIRGPETFRREDWTYRNSTKGSILDFHGIELISIRDVAIYARRYQGGLIKDRAYDVEICS